MGPIFATGNRFPADRRLEPGFEFVVIGGDRSGIRIEIGLDDSHVHKEIPRGMKALLKREIL